MASACNAIHSASMMPGGHEMPEELDRSGAALLKLLVSLLSLHAMKHDWKRPRGARRRAARGI